MIPLLAAVPAVMMGAVGLVGGAAALAGGAMSLAGGVINAGSTMAGIAADAAGGVITSEQDFDRAAARAALLAHASYDYLRSYEQLLKVGATGTNLGDLVLVIARS